MKINTRDLKKVCDALFERLIEAHGIESVDIDDSLYWKISHEAAFDPDNEPKSFHIGNLVDDWEFIRGMADGTNQPVVYQLTELAPILSYIGETLAPKLGAKGG